MTHNGHDGLLTKTHSLCSFTKKRSLCSLQKRQGCLITNSQPPAINRDKITLSSIEEGDKVSKDSKDSKVFKDRRDRRVRRDRILSGAMNKQSSALTHREPNKNYKKRSRACVCQKKVLSLQREIKLHNHDKRR